MKMTLSQEIAGPVEQVFQAFTDFPNAAERVSGITKVEMLTDGPVGVGTRFKETRVFMKREATEELEVTRFEPGREVALSAYSCGCDFLSTFQFTPIEAGTRIDLTFESTPKTFFAKLMSPLGKLMMGPMKKCVQQDMDDLKQGIEARAQKA